MPPPSAQPLACATRRPLAFLLQPAKRCPGSAPPPHSTPPDTDCDASSFDSFARHRPKTCATDQPVHAHHPRVRPTGPGSTAGRGMGLLLGTAASGLPPNADGPMSHWRLASEIRGANGLIGSEPGGLRGKTPGKY
uniref:Uncharacterized protein n=1 Tax=Eutreptiella gymnastica TaxID=73025 RepID=A0A7S4FDY8_9EUGL